MVGRKFQKGGSRFALASARSSCRLGSLLASVFLIAFSAPGAADSDPQLRSRPSIILAVFDTTRFDDWSYLGTEPKVTPVLDSLSAHAHRFSRAYSLYTATVPSHISIFTGHAVVRHGTPDDSPLRDSSFGYERSSLFTILGENGYRTLAFSGNKNVHAETIAALKTVHVTSRGLHEKMSQERVAKILSAYGEYVANPESLNEDERSAYERHRRVVMGNAENVNLAAIAAMTEYARESPTRPYFLFVNYNDAHDPYFPDSPYAGRFRSKGASEFNGNIWNPAQREKALIPPGLPNQRLALTSLGLSAGDIARARDLHLGELSYADQQFGALLLELDRLNLLEFSIIVGVADHGELFGEHGRMSHSGKPVEELIHVPLFIRIPDSRYAPAIIDARVDLRDIKPTLLDYLGIADDSSRGRSLLPLIEDASAKLPAPSPVPARDTESGGAENIVEGQDPETTEKLIEQLRALGYIE